MKDSFIVQLAVRLLFQSWGWPPTAIAIATPVLSYFLGALADQGILKLDLTIDSMKNGMKLRDFYPQAKAAYDHATARIYDPAEKEAIRKRYRDLLRGAVAFGNGMR